MTSNTSPEGLSDENRALVKRFYSSQFGEDGTVSGSRTAQCLNECGPAWPVTWKADCLAAEAREERLVIRALRTPTRNNPAR